MSRPVGMGRAALIIGASVLLSRVLGVLREALLASLFGVTVEGDLYRHAFLIPDLLNYFVAGAYLTITLVPLLNRRLQEGGPQAANHAFTAVFRFVAFAILILTALMWLFADPLVGRNPGKMLGVRQVDMRSAQPLPDRRRRLDRQDQVRRPRQRIVEFGRDRQRRHVGFSHARHKSADPPPGSAGRCQERRRNGATSA